MVNYIVYLDIKFYKYNFKVISVPNISPTKIFIIISDFKVRLIKIIHYATFIFKFSCTKNLIEQQLNKNNIPFSPVARGPDAAHKE